ncbi:vacuolar protein sorting-associated protein 13A isoform X2 [Cephus cinctus]|uniref:Vacuolar protein sorting-associated protein 13A isoform X2 n=1 Tax=Cephus cinctus TaxID=211228 RepID=A0AAJ7BV07_CEPCN|nr:vacuolar protein sorting-associated protein 13A isoform X2 [Cephus cinctus]
MFEGAVAALLNRFLGKYVEDLDTEQFNVGIFSGDTYLTDLKLKPEALYQLGLPIRVEIGLIGKINLKIPWTGLSTQPTTLSIQDIYIVAVPATSGSYNMEMEKRLIRATKRRILEHLEEDSFLGPGVPPDSFDRLITSVIKNFQITVNNIHIRYEDRLSNNSPIACGLCIQSLSMATTNNKWKPGVTSSNSSSMYHLVRAESFSVYLDSNAEPSLPTYPKKWELSTLLAWKTIMFEALQTFSMNNQEFQFLVKPFTTKIKIIINKSNEARVPRLLVDIVLQDIATQFSERQYNILCHISDSLHRVTIIRPFQKYRPIKTVQKNPKAWWKYAYSVVLDHNVRPYTWDYFWQHRTNYRKYKETFLRTLRQPNDTELKMDLQKYEDTLTIVNVVIAREHAKVELKKKEPGRVLVDTRNPTAFRLLVNHEKIHDIYMQLTDVESQELSGMVINAEKLENVPKHIDRKYNFSLINYSLSFLLNDREVLVVTLTQFLASIETRPGLLAYKVSARAESFVIEGASAENELVPLITTDNVLTGNMASNFLSVDFEKNPVNSDYDYDISVTLEPLEVTYHKHAVNEIIKFFKTDDMRIDRAVIDINEICTKKCASVLDSIFTRRLRVNLKMDLKGPYFIFPERGSLQKGGNVLLFDVGKMSLRSELQATDVQFEDATLMELEEILYDRIHISFDDGHVLLCHSGDDWRDARKRKDSEYHLIPKIHANVTWSRSVKPEYRSLPRTKLNATVSSFKLNLSEKKFQCILNFLELIPVPTLDKSEKRISNKQKALKELKRGIAFSIDELIMIRSVIVLASTVTGQGHSQSAKKEGMGSNCSGTDVEGSAISSEISEEDLERWTRAVDLPGFDDNVSPHNRVNFLMRFVIGELSVHLEHSIDGTEYPYLILRICTLYLEAAIMEYGPAIQFGIGSILLADKTNAGVTGSYLELVSTNGSTEVLAILYRKVRANCPDFKSHFKSIEQSLVIDVATINFVFHRYALLKLKDYYTNVARICKKKNVGNIFNVAHYSKFAFWKKKKDDPPIPPGALKLSYSARLNTFILRLCDRENDLLEVNVSGVESDCIYKANERMILRAHVRSLTVEDLTEFTLYTKLVTTDEDKICDLKYVRHTPKLYACPDIDTEQDDVMADGSFKLSIGRMNIVFISKILHECQNFMEPFLYLLCEPVIASCKCVSTWGIQQFRNSGTKLRIFVDIQGPTLLLPQKKDIPNLIVFATGVLTAENFFKEKAQIKQSVTVNGNNSYASIIENILLKLKSMTISRAVMTLSGTLEVQEPILEPVNIRFDIKRTSEYRSTTGSHKYGLCEVRGSMDLISINVGQKDLMSMFSVWEDNLAKVLGCQGGRYNRQSLTNLYLDNSIAEDATVKKLEVFFAQNEHPSCEISTKLTLDGLQLYLFSDAEEILSSPVRDLSHGLCRLTVGEISSSLDIYNDHSINMKVSVKSCLLEDTCNDTSSVKKIIQSPAKTIGMNLESHISVSMPPILDITFTQASSGDKCFDMLVEETRINLSIPFIINVGRYFADALPGEQVDKGVINRGYDGDSNLFIKSTEGSDIPAGLDQTNIGKQASCISAACLEEQPGTSISIRIRKPEVLVFGDLKANNAHVILFQAELMIECSRHAGLSSIVCTFSDIRAKSKSQNRYLKQSPHWVLQPCDVEICKKEQLLNYNVQITAAVSSVQIHLSAGIIQTFLDITKEALVFLKCNEVEANMKDLYQENISYADLWSQKKISCIPYKKVEEEFLEKSIPYEMEDQCEVLELKPVSIDIMLEMEDTIERLPAAKANCEISITIKDWSHKFQMLTSLKLYAFCYNVEYGNWEPFIELCSTDGVYYRPWELVIKAYQADAYALNSDWKISKDQTNERLSRKKKRDTESSEDEANGDMVFIRPEYVVSSKMREPIYNREENDDSDSDDHGEIGKLTRTFNRLFIKDSSDGEGSDSDESSKCEDEGLEQTPEHHAESHCSVPENTTKLNQAATYITIHAEDKINLTVTPNTIALLDTVLNIFSKSKSGIPIVMMSTRQVNLYNDIGYPSRIELLVKEESHCSNGLRLIAAREFQVPDSPTSAPSTPESDHFAISPSNFATIENDLSDQSGSISYDRNRQSTSFQPFPDNSVVDIYKVITQERLKVVMEGFDETTFYCPKRQRCKLIPLSPVRHGIRYHLLLEVNIDRLLHQTITVRTPLQIRNDTTYALGLYYKKALFKKLDLPCVGEALNPFDDNMRMTILEPDHVYNVPLYIAYHVPIYILPTYAEKYQVSDSGIWWKELSENMNSAKDVYCYGKEGKDTALFAVKVIYVEKRTVTNANSQVPQCELKIVPPVIFNNRLPFAVEMKIPNVEYNVRIEPGEKVSAYTVKCDSDHRCNLEIYSYLGCQWSGTFMLTSELEMKFVKMTADCESEGVKSLVLCVELNKSESWVITIYAQYWIVNKTGLPLYIREIRSNIIYEIPGEELIVFSQKKSRRRLVRLRAHQSDWSAAFGLNAICSTSLIVCKDGERRRKYKIQAKMTTSHFSPLLTKILTFLPNFLVINKTKRKLRFMEENEEADLWNDLLPSQAIAFWPCTESMKMRVKWNNSQLVSQHFDFSMVGENILRMDNGTALCVEVQRSNNSPFSITFRRYQNGDAPVRVDNFCEDLFLKIHQINLGQVALLSPFQSLLYTWDDPSKTRELIWNVYDNKTKGYKAQFQTDGYGQETVSFRTLKRTTITDSSISFSEKFTSSTKSPNSMTGQSSSDDTDSETELEISSIEQVRKDRAIVYWVSFKEKHQRVLLFTQDENIFLKAKFIVEPEPSQIEVFCSLAGIGMSIVVHHEERLRELAYAAITDSAPHWEVSIGNRWKTLTLELSAWIEDKCKASLKKAQLDNFIDIDFTKMHMTKPFFGKLRRTYSPGIWFHYRSSYSNIYLQGKIYRVQIDNQLRGALFPVVLSSDSKQCFASNVTNRKLKPAVELLCVKQKKATHDVYKKIIIVVREFTLKLHEEFLVRLLDDLMPKRIETKFSVAARLRKDLSNIHHPLYCTKEKINDGRHKTVVEFFHVSPLKIYLKLLASAEGLNARLYNSTSSYCSFVRFLFEYACREPFEKSAEIRIPHYEKIYITVDIDQFLKNTWESYIGKVTQQFNVLILSSTVLGNPYGYNFKIAADSICESDLIPTGEEIADKLSYEIACLLGNCTADVTQSSLLNFDNTEHCAIRPKDKAVGFESTQIPLTVLMANSSFPIGVELELSGLVVKPTSTVYQEELKYFLRTLGKRILSLTKKESVAHFLPSLIMDTIKRAQDIGYEFVSRVRLPRYVNPYLGVEFYSSHKAMGMHLLNTISNGHYADMDAYWAHVVLSTDGERIALVSLRRIFLLEKRCMWGSWNVVWTIEVNQLVQPPKVVKNKLIFYVNKNEKTCALNTDWYIESNDKIALEWLCRQAESVIILNMENSICVATEYEMS